VFDAAWENALKDATSVGAAPCWRAGKGGRTIGDAAAGRQISAVLSAFETIGSLAGNDIAANVVPVPAVAHKHVRFRAYDASALSALGGSGAAAAPDGASEGKTAPELAQAEALLAAFVVALGSAEQLRVCCGKFPSAADLVRSVAMQVRAVAPAGTQRGIAAEYLATELERVLLQAPGSPLPLQRETVELLRRLWRCRLRLALNANTPEAPRVQMGRSRSLQYNATDLAAVTHRALDILADGDVSGEGGAKPAVGCDVLQMLQSRQSLSREALHTATEYCAAHDFINRLLSESVILEAVVAAIDASSGSAANWGALRRYAQLAAVYGAETETALTMLKDVPALAQRLHTESPKVGCLV
jgi:hypothetical protein